jgi:hypothetical protein
MIQNGKHFHGDIKHFVCGKQNMKDFKVSVGVWFLGAQATVISPLMRQMLSAKA